MTTVLSERRPPSATEDTGPAFVFPGQGSQYAGMMRELHRCGAAARSLIHDAERITGIPIAELMTTADAETLANPHIAQVLVYVASTVLLSELESREWTPAAVAGHSLGEYPALVAADMLTWEQALRLVDARGAAMAAAACAHDGSMAAIVGLAPRVVGELCLNASCDGEYVGIANINSPTQLVVSGARDAVDRVVGAARATGALRAKLLPVGGAYHSPLMDPAAEELRPLLLQAPLSPPTTTMVSSATGRVVDDVDSYRDALAEQVVAPVRWQETMATLTAAGLDTFVEVGPGRVLTGLCRDNARGSNRQLAAEVLTMSVAARV